MEACVLEDYKLLVSSKMFLKYLKEMGSASYNRRFGDERVEAKLTSRDLTNHQKSNKSGNMHVRLQINN